MGRSNLSKLWGRGGVSSRRNHALFSMFRALPFDEDNGFGIGSDFNWDDDDDDDDEDNDDEDYNDEDYDDDEDFLEED